MRGGVTQDLQTAFAMGNEQLLVAMSDPDLEAAWIAAMKDRLTLVKFGKPAPCTRTMRLYAEIRKLVGTQPALYVNLIAELGASSELEARRAITILQEAERTPLDEKVEKTCRWLVQALIERPDLRDRAHEWLGFFAVPELEPHANGMSP
jgi:hypothetical protein